MRRPGEVTLFLCGDVMLGRGVDQILPHPSNPKLYEPLVTSALDYVDLAERANGPIPRGVGFDYVWGESLRVLKDVSPDARIINLETSVTTSEDAVRKGINYRMHPDNVGVLEAAGIDCCVLANNHVLDWGEAGLLETLETLEHAGVRMAGAGPDALAAADPAVLDAGDDGRVLVFALGAEDSGVPPSWAATPEGPGVNVLSDFSDETVDRIATVVQPRKRPGDIAVVSIHWGRNWGFAIPSDHQRLARALIDRASVDVVYGHSSHHPKAIEVYRGRPILYGCGDFITDYEGIAGYEEYRGDLALMYFPTLEQRTGVLIRLQMKPLRVRRFRLTEQAPSDIELMQDTLDRECRRFGHRIHRDGGMLALG